MRHAASTNHHDEESEQRVVEMLKDRALDGRGQLVHAARPVDREIFVGIVSKVTRRIQNVHFDTRPRRQHVTAAERNAVRQQQTAFHLPSTPSTRHQ